MRRRSARALRPRVSIVVLTCGAPEATIACLESVAAGSYRNLQFVVVCNGAGPQVEAAVLAFAERGAVRGFDMRVLSNDINAGSCAGRNQALAHVDGEFVAFIDNDIGCNDPLWLN